MEWNFQSFIKLSLKIFLKMEKKFGKIFFQKKGRKNIPLIERISKIDDIMNIVQLRWTIFLYYCIILLDMVCHFEGII